MTVKVMFIKPYCGKGIWFGFLPVLFVAACVSGGCGSNKTSQACGLDYWVSTAGDDNSGSGSAASPFLTLDRARMAVRQNPLRGQCAISVNIQQGSYPLVTPLRFDQFDSGSPRARVTYRAAAGANAPVIISGGIAVDNFTCTIANICTATVANLPTGLMPRQFYVNGRRAIRAR